MKIVIVAAKLFLNYYLINYSLLITIKMSSTDVSKLTSQELAELACTYSALILHDDGQEITGTP